MATETSHKESAASMLDTRPMDFAEICRLPPIQTEGVTLRQLFWALNAEIEKILPFGEYGFSVLDHDATQPYERDAYKWIDVATMRGGSEGWYIHVTLIPYRHDREPSKLIALAKTWSKPEALFTAALATHWLNP